MKKFLIILGAIVCFVIIGVVALFFFAMRQSASIAAEATPYVDESVIAITSNWAPTELMVRFLPEIRQTTDLEDVEALFDVAARTLGPRLEYIGAELTDFRSQVSVGAESTTAADFVASARFENGDASFSITVQKIDGRWMIYRFTINSSSLLRGIAGDKA